VEVHQSQRTAPARIAHPVMLQLVGGVELSSSTLTKRSEDATGALVQMLANAEYWLSFDLASFEPLLAKSPSPLRELGVAIALKFGEGLDGGLSLDDLSRAREALAAKIAEDLKKGIEEGLGLLERAVRARESIAELEADGFHRYQVTQARTVNALRAMGKSKITVVGHADDDEDVPVKIGERIVLSASDEKGRPLPAPEIESHLDAPLYAKDEKQANTRTVFLLVPGEYFVRVPGRATGDRKLIAT
jgi:hypothetical protein